MRQFIEVERMDANGGSAKSILNINHIVEIREESNYITIITLNSSINIETTLEDFKKYAQIPTELDTRKIGF